MIYDGILEGKLVFLKSATLEDAEFTYEIRQDKSRTKYLHSVSGGIEKQKTWLTEQMARKGDYFFVVYDRNTGERIGTDGIYNINDNGDTGEAGRALINGTPAQNLEAGMLNLDFAFDELGLKKLVGCVVEGNKSVLHLNKKFGFVENYTEYSRELRKNLIWISMDKPGYEAKRSGIADLIDRYCQSTE